MMELKCKKILVCDGSVDGIFTAIYKAYDLRYGHENIKIIEKDPYVEQELFAEYIEIETDYELSYKVGNSLQKKISKNVYDTAITAALSGDNGRADIIYRFVVLAFQIGNRILEHRYNDTVDAIHRLIRNVNNEIHHMQGFLRFQEVADGFLLSIIRPKNNIVGNLANFFEERLNNENFIIFDEGRSTAAVHQKNQTIFLVPMKKEVLDEMIHIKSDQEEYENLWKAFFKSISIKERENPKLQRNLMPLHFRNYMTEFQ